MSSDSNATVAFFGATGGCTNACVAHALKAGYHIVALARTPSKLTAQLLNQGINQETLDAQLRIVKGDATDVEAVKSTILGEASDGEPALVSTIISGIGGLPHLGTKHGIIPTFKLDNPHITEQTTQAMLSALRDVYAKYPNLAAENAKPLLAIISTTGLSPAGMPTDMPLFLRPIYKIFLEEPHEDKRQMENLIASNTDLFSGTIIVRPTLFAGDGSLATGKGLEKLRVGTEAKPALGYTIQKADVGHWIFEEVIKNGGQKWNGEKVSLTA